MNNKIIAVLVTFSFLILVMLVMGNTKDKPVGTKNNGNNHDLNSKQGPIQQLGKKIFFDTNLSNPAGQSCASCHMPNKAFSDPEQMAVSRGAIKSRFGKRNAPSVSYLSFSPFFQYDSINKNYLGGLFWDGRSSTLADQAGNPFLSASEMNNTNKQMVVEKVLNSEYKDLFYYVFGPDAFDNNESAFKKITEALEEFEETSEVSPFTSKFDYYMKGEATLTAAEKRGMELFNNEKKGKCAACHPSNPDPITGAILFTDFTFDNLGLPANVKVVQMNKSYTADNGLGSVLKNQKENGKFKVPTLRNTAVTAPYFHNGIFATLNEVMDFYNSRDTGKFGKPEIPENVNHEELGDLKLTKEEMDDIIAFLNTLTDGYRPVESGNHISLE